MRIQPWICLISVLLREPSNDSGGRSAGRAEKKLGRSWFSLPISSTTLFDLQKDQDYEVFMLWNGNQTTTVIHLTISPLEYPFSQKEEWSNAPMKLWTFCVPDIRDQSYSGANAQTLLPITHNLYHYQILIKYRLEDELGPDPQQVLALTQERENSELQSQHWPWATAIFIRRRRYDKINLYGDPAFNSLKGLLTDDRYEILAVDPARSCCWSYKKVSKETPVKQAARGRTSYLPTWKTIWKSEMGRYYEARSGWNCDCWLWAISSKSTPW